ncbi:hypothetical protein Trydic_g2112 [Trypoxylus dichotomus]
MVNPWPTCKTFEGKVVLCAWWYYEGIIHFHLVLKGRTLNFELYCEHLDHMLLQRLEEFEKMELPPHSACSPCRKMTHFPAGCVAQKSGANPAQQTKSAISTFKYGSASVMVWKAIGTAGIGHLAFIDGIMDRLLQKRILQCSMDTLGLGRDWIFQQNNDPGLVTVSCSMLAL